METTTKHFEGMKGTRRDVVPAAFQDTVEERNKAVIRQWNTRIWTDDEQVFAEIPSQYMVIHELGGLGELMDTIARMKEVFGDITLTIEDQVAEDDRVVTRWTLRGVHRGTLWGVPPTGRMLTYRGISIDRLEDGRIVEEWYQSDFCGLMHQLGVPLPV